ncbi:MAG: hypothetical protein ACNYZH_01250 [Acidimicrobiia bacterium]
MTNQGAFAGTRPVTWPRAAVGAAFFLGLMIVLFVVLPNQFVTSDPSQFTKIITIAYVVVLFGLVAWMVAAWQNRGQSAPTPVTDKVSVFGRPMREGPGFASFAEKAAPSPQQSPTQAKSVRSEPVEDASAFGRPLKKGSK